MWVYTAASGDGPLREDTPLASTGSEHVYTASKIAAELVVSSFGELYGLPYTILRYGIPFGPRMRKELAIPQFLHRARIGRKDHHPWRRAAIPQLHLRRRPGRSPCPGAR